MKKMLMVIVGLVMSAAAFAQTSFEVYVYDQQGGKTNIRNAPNGKVVASLEQNDEYNMVVTECKNNWWRIDGGKVFPFEANEIRLKGSTTGYWIHSSVIGFTGQGEGGVTLYQSPNKKSKVVVRTKNWTMVRPIGVQNGWVKVRVDGTKKEGWMPMNQICANPVTNCC